MRILAVVAACFLSMNAFGGELLKAVYYPGFEMNPVKYEVTLDESGLVSAKITPFRDNLPESTAELAHFHANVVEKISKNITLTDISKDLIDLQEGEPMCTDTPTIVVLIIKDGVEKEIYKRHSCHEFRLEENYHLYSTVGIAKSLIDLAKI